MREERRGQLTTTFAAGATQPAHIWSVQIESAEDNAPRRQPVFEIKRRLLYAQASKPQNNGVMGEEQQPSS